MSNGFSTEITLSQLLKDIFIPERSEKIKLWDLPFIVISFSLSTAAFAATSLKGVWITRSYAIVISSPRRAL